MSGYCGPKIIDDGLIMNLDASDLNSRYGLNYNLLSIANWTVGTGSITGYAQNGASSQNIRNFNTDPYGNTSITWNSISDGNYGGNGGWDGSQFVVDVSKTHRFSVWIQKYFQGNNSGSYYLGLNGGNTASSTLGVFNRTVTNVTLVPTCSANNTLITASSHGLSNGSRIHFYESGSGVLPSGISTTAVYYVISSSANEFAISTTSGGSPVTMTTAGTPPFYADGNLNTNPYFFAGSWSNSPLMTTGNWYLLVGYAFASGSGTGTVHPDTGIYNISGSKIYSNGASFVIRSSIVNSRLRHRTYLYYSTGSVGTAVTQLFFNPRVDALDGTEPSISDLINNNPNKFKNLINPSQFGYIQGNLNTISKSFGGYNTPASQINQYIVLPESCLQSLTNGYTWTFEYWMEPLSDLNGRYGPTMTVSGGNDFLIAYSSTSFNIYTATLVSGTDPTYTVNVPMLVTITRNTSTWRIYKNGVFAAEYSYVSADTKTITGWIADQEQDSVKGSFESVQNVNANWYSFKLYDKILSDSDILNNYNMIKTRFGVR